MAYNKSTWLVWRLNEPVPSLFDRIQAQTLGDKLAPTVLHPRWEGECLFSSNSSVSNSHKYFQFTTSSFQHLNGNLLNQLMVEKVSRGNHTGVRNLPVFFKKPHLNSEGENGKADCKRNLPLNWICSPSSISFVKAAWFSVMSPLAILCGPRQVFIFLPLLLLLFFLPLLLLFFLHLFLFFLLLFHVVLLLFLSQVFSNHS